MSSGTLAIVRHSESEWNALGEWTGIADVDLTPKGVHEGELLGEKLRGIHFSLAYISEQVRTLETLQAMLKTQDQPGLPYERRWAINERDYGEYTGLNKWQVEEKLGEKQFNCIRRDWACPVPGGEMLKDVYARAVPFYQHELVPQLLKDHNILVVSHGNAIRALIKFIEDISDEGISHVEMIFGTILLYTIHSDGRMAHKEVRTIKATLPPA
jgi:2,3-bisphosphoglycerate-dependent phosphoglycerate mutase